MSHMHNPYWALSARASSTPILHPSGCPSLPLLRAWWSVYVSWQVPGLALGPVITLVV